MNISVPSLVLIIIYLYVHSESSYFSKLRLFFNLKKLKLVCSLSRFVLHQFQPVEPSLRVDKLSKVGSNLLLWKSNQSVLRREPTRVDHQGISQLKSVEPWKQYNILL